MLVSVRIIQNTVKKFFTKIFIHNFSGDQFFSRNILYMNLFLKFLVVFCILFCALLCLMANFKNENM